MRALLRFFGLGDLAADRARLAPSTLGPGIRIKGELHGEGVFVVDGFFEGEIVLNGTLEIGPHGQVDGNVTADEIVIGGVMRGNLSAGAKVEILPTGSLTGSVRSAAFSAADGATVKGEVWIEPPTTAEARA
jgi:cytoskeletal protein CcmA (bactofilin family)